MSTPLEHDYIGLSEPCLMEKTTDNNALKETETELRLGLPGSGSGPGHGLSLFGQDFEDSKNVTSRTKRVFSDASEKWDLSINCRSQEAGFVKGDDVLFSQKGGNVGSSSKSVEGKKSQQASKAQVVGWPPIRSFRKNTLATTSSKNSDAEGKSSSSCLFVKVSLDGAPYLRKVDIKLYSNYAELSSALEKMFSSFTIGQCTVGKRLPGQEKLNESRLMDLVNGSEHVLTYEDKDGDWMLVGDVPWEMFIGTCKRLRIMKSSDAIGLAPRAINKCKNQN